ncbi:MAG: hypothetical protein NTW28_24415, partial [Candidatus Solibacter sp.]|nr:hypothetical protein [Candidatus Solibacter sp.]
MRKNSPFSLPSVLMLLLATLVVAQPALGQTCVSLTTMGAASTQNFDTLANATGTTYTLGIPGWYMSETGANANGLYAVGTGSSNTGDTYSFGATGSSDRALGGLRSGNLVPIVGACFKNDTGAAIVSLAIAYTGEQWRLGFAGRPDQLNFEYSTNATDLVTGTWTGVAALNFVAPVTVTVGAKDGNAAANRTARTSTITLGIVSGATVWIRWTDTDATNADDGLAIDDFSLTPQGLSGSAPPTATGQASPNPLTAGNPVSLSATPTSGTNPPSNSYTETCNLTAIGGGLSVTLPTSYLVPAVTTPATYLLPCTITDDISRSSGFNISLTVQPPPPTLRTISEINGPGTASPLAGLSVTTRGVVTAVRASTGSVRGFYIEALTADRDADPNTSEGLLVFTGNTDVPGCATVGNYIQIEGTVSNFVTSTAPVGSLPLTELANQANCQVLGTNQLGTLPAAVTIDAGNPLVVGGGAAQSRKWMGMRVSVPSATVVGASLGFKDEPTAQSAASGEFFVTVPGVTRPLHGAGILDTRRPSAAAATVPAWNGNPESLRVNVTGLFPAGTPYEVAAGSTVTGLSGVMDYNTSAGQFQLYTNSTGAGTPNPATPTLSATPVPVSLPSDLTIGSFNMERFYNDAAE